MVTIKEDPRKDKFWPAKTNTENRMIFDTMVSKLQKSYQKFTDIKTDLELVEKLLENQPDSIKKSMTKWSKQIKTEMDSIEHLFFNKENQKGIQRNPNVIMSKIFQANSYINEPWHGNEGNASLALNHAITNGERGMEAIQTFIDKTWLPFKAKFSALPVVIFKE